MKTHLAVALLTLLGLAFSLAFLALTLSLRRRRRSAADPEASADGDDAAPSSKNLIFHLLCFKKPSSRVEPAAVGATTPVIVASVKPVVVEAEEEEGDVEAWSAAWFGPSMLLYTIKEEELEVSGRLSASGESEEEVVVFQTPCSSPAYYTPASSPLREAEEKCGGDAEVVLALVRT